MGATPAAAVDGYTNFSFAHADIEHVVYVRGEGPPVIVVHELPGLTPAAIRFGERLAREGFRCHLPLLFGRPFDDDAPGAFKKLCVSREFANLEAGVSAPITNWLRALARELGTRHHSRVGAIGMCLTGAFAIPMILEPTVSAHVAAQPGSPFRVPFTLLGIGRGPWMRQLNISDDDLNAAAARAKAEQLTLLTLRFDVDRICPAERMERLRESFGDRLQLHELKTTGALRRLLRPPHATLTSEYEKAPDRPDEPTRIAFSVLVEFLRARL